jgi:hypothetical protein
MAGRSSISSPSVLSRLDRLVNRAREGGLIPMRPFIRPDSVAFERCRKRLISLPQIVWVADFNTCRPHSALGYRTPAAYAAQLTAPGDRQSNLDQLGRSPFALPAHTRHSHRCREPREFGRNPLSLRCRSLMRQAPIAGRIPLRKAWPRIGLCVPNYTTA